MVFDPESALNAADPFGSLASEETPGSGFIPAESIFGWSWLKEW